MSQKPYKRGGVKHSEDRVRGSLTLDITGPPNGTTNNHENCAAAAPVHVVVRWSFGIVQVHR
jgi:hypothetical protein